MSDAVAQIVARLRGLSQQDRAALARELLLSLEPEDSDAEAASNEELVRRADRIRGGQAAGTPAEQVFANWRQGRQ